MNFDSVQKQLVVYFNIGHGNKFIIVGLVMSMAYVNEIYRIREGKLYFLYMYFTNANKKHKLYRAFYLIKINIYITQTKHKHTVAQQT